MNPEISNFGEEHDIFKFTLSGVNVSLANALRRIILNDIQTVVFRTETYADNQCTIEINNSRLHNEILKQRLSCIPIFSEDPEELPGKYIMEVDVKNDSDHIMFVTSGDFKIKNKTNGNYLTEKEVRRLFPPDAISGDFIDFARLRPRIGDVPGEHLKLSCEFSVANVATNSMFNVVSKCAYGFTVDSAKSAAAWEKIEAKMAADGSSGGSSGEIAFAKRNFELLDAQRYFKEDSFDFVLRSVGVFTCPVIVKKACAIMQRKLRTFSDAIDADTVPILATEVSGVKTTMDNCYDIILENEDYTLGKALEYYLYQTFFVEKKTMNFCGFKKLHPHDSSSRIRVAFIEPADKVLVREHLREACTKLQEVYVTIHSKF
jgi:DNA-directed RNA polymerase subunit L